MPVSDLHQADASANQSARVEMPPYLVSAPDQPVNGVESRRERPERIVSRASGTSRAGYRCLVTRLSLPRFA